MSFLFFIYVFVSKKALSSTKRPLEQDKGGEQGGSKGAKGYAGLRRWTHEA